MQVVYRITDIPSTNPSPIYQDDKPKLNELCLKSFISAFEDVKPKVIFLADHVDNFDCIEQFPWEFEVRITHNGQNQAMLNSYNIAKKIDDYVLFQECDYIYRPGTGKHLLEAMKNLDIVSPYDHPNFYRTRELHSNVCKIELVGGKHYRTCERNTMTWGCYGGIISDNLDLFLKHGYLDGQIWYDLLERGVDLWTPITSYATHMVVDNLAPGVDWEEIWSSIQ